MTYKKNIKCILVFEIIILILFFNDIYVAFSWSNGGYSSNSSLPDYGTHDWIAEHAKNWLPESERKWIDDNLNYFLYGTEFPDNSGASYGNIVGYGDVSKHHNYYDKNGQVIDNSAALRVKTEFEKALSELKAGRYTLAAIYAGSMSHYINDVAVFGHVIEPEQHHSDYEDYVKTRTTSYNYGIFESFLAFDGFLNNFSAYDASIELGRNTFYDDGGLYTAYWMDANYNWNDQVFKDRCGESLNLATNYLADTLHTLYTLAYNETKYSLIIQNSDGLGYTIPSSNQYFYSKGENVQINATPQEGWILDHWLLDNINMGNSNPYNIKMNTDHVLKAVFKQLTYSLTIQIIGSGSINPSGEKSYDKGTIISISANASTGWQFDHWELNGNPVGASNPYQITMNANYLVKAVFTQTNQGIPSYPMFSILLGIFLTISIMMNRQKKN